MWRGIQAKMHMSRSDLEGIMNLLEVLFFVLCLQRVCASVIDASEEGQDHSTALSVAGNGTDAEKSVEEKMKELRIELVKFQILSKLNLKEPPPRASTGSSELSKEAVRLLLETEEETRHHDHHFGFRDNDERLIIHAKHNNKPCFLANETYCKAFYFELSITLNTSTTDFWVYKTSGSSSKALTLIVFFSNKNEKKQCGNYSFDLQKLGWNKLELPIILLPAAWNKDFTYTVEVIGQTIEYIGEHRPFLMVSKSSFIASRKTRDISCNVNESCCLQPLRVSFAEIGFTWVLYPAELEANMCTGKCRMDHSALKTHYERAMSKVLESDSNLQESLGECWTLCCKPKELEAVRVIYNDTDGIIHDQYIPELSVKSCSCS